MRVILLGVMVLGGHLCAGAQQSGSPQGEPSQQTFASVTDATNAMIKAVRAHDHQAVRAIFGSEVTNLLTGDTALDEKHFDEFATNLAEQCAAVPQGSNRMTLEIGTARWPFPIPLIENNGVWFFDETAGEDEIINRHIGRDESYAIGVCRQYVKAQRQYAQRFADPNGTPKYAERFKSTQGKFDGLYWPLEPGGAASPLASFVSEAGAEGHDWGNGKGPRAFHGYLFKVLTSQGPAAPGGKMNYVAHGEMTAGFAMVAWPVRWGESGIMTFIVNQDGIIYQRSLAEKTGRVAAAMKDYNPDNRWTVVADEGITDLTAGQQPSGMAP